MATDFWSSSHYNHWLVDRLTLQKARADDLLYASSKEIGLIQIMFGNVIARLGRRLDLRQQVVATATVFFRRFYLRSSYCDTDPFLVVATCCYVAAKVEEAPVHMKSVVTEARALFSTEYDIKTFPTDHTKLGEMEFYLLEDLDFHLTVYHPYRDLADLCGTHEVIDVGEEGEVGYVPEGERFWGTGRGKLELEDGAIQTAWFILSDSLRTDVCLLYPPHLIAVAALYMTCVLHGSVSSKLHPVPSSSNSASATPTPIAASRMQSPAAASVIPPLDTSTTSDLASPLLLSPLTPHPEASPLVSDPNTTPNTAQPQISPREKIISFLAGLNVSLSTVSLIIQQLMGMYALWDHFTDQSEHDATRRHQRNLSNRQYVGLMTGAGGAIKPEDLVTEKDVVKILLRMRDECREAHSREAEPVKKKSGA